MGATSGAPIPGITRASPPRRVACEANKNMMPEGLPVDQSLTRRSGWDDGECLDRLFVFSDAGLRRILSSQVT
jgi:hypothetical protein